MKNILKISVGITLAALLLGACTKDFINKDKPYSMTESMVYNDADYIESVLLGCYAEFKASNPSFMGGLGFVVFDSRGDDIINVSNPVTMQDTYEMRILSTSTENSRIWNCAYGTINSCNIFIDKLEEYGCEEVLGAAKYKQFVAEAKFIRAYCYYVLANLYSQPYTLNPNALAVPLRLTGLTSSGNNNCPAATITEVYNQILADCLPDDLAADSNSATRASSAAAHLLKMRVYMAMNNWASAISEGNACGSVKLAADVSKLYGADANKNSSELIFGMPMTNQDNPNTQMSAAEYFSQKALVAWIDTESGILSKEAYSLDADQRISKLMTAPDDDDRVFSKKYTDYGTKLDFIPLMRGAEIELNLAECYVNNSDEANAKKYLKEVRQRSIAAADDILDVDSLSGADLKEAVYNERRLEFICEGMRGIDIIRRGETFVKKNSKVDIEVGPTSTYYIWPMTQSEVNYNKELNKK